MQLQPNTLLQGGKYKIERVLGQGGFGITYLGEQVALGRKVAIKEFFMKEYCDRDNATSHVTLGTASGTEIVGRFKEKFLKEARLIASFENPHIVRIHDIFEENGTAYYVMEHLQDRWNEFGQCLPLDKAVGIITQVGDALTYIHEQNVLHLDVKPSNILFRKDTAVLIDFGISKHYDETGGQTSTTPAGLSKGYAPTEQSSQDITRFSPATDVYSLAATMYKLLTGIIPPEASVVLNDGLPLEPLRDKHVLDNVIAAIEKAMSPAVRNRYQSVREFVVEISTVKAFNSQNVSPIVNTNVSPIDDDSTVVNVELKKNEEERLRKEAEAKAAKESEDACTMEDAEHKAREEQELKNETENASSKYTSMTWLWIVVGVSLAFAFFLWQWNNSSNYTNEPQKISSTTFTANGVSFEMMLVKAGRFTMGATEEMDSTNYLEEPAHEVKITRDYYIGRTEVTQKLWQAVMGINPSLIKGENRPVENVSWDDCQTFIAKLNSITGKEFRMLTEAEWEFAARGGCNSRHTQFSGSNVIADVAWYFNNSDNQHHSVATKSPNELGIYDMSGNVREWCFDFWDYYSEEKLVDPKITNPGSQAFRVIRGGSFQDYLNGSYDIYYPGGSFCHFPSSCRSSVRFSDSSSYKNGDLGLRIAISNN